MTRPTKTVILSNENYQRLAKTYRQYLETLGYSLATVQTKHRQLIRFLHWIETNQVQKIEAVEVHHLEQYKIHLQQQPNKNTGGSLSPKTVYGELRAVELFFIMQQSRGAITANPFSTFKNTYKASGIERTILTQAEIKALYEATKNDQERAMLSLLMDAD